MIDNLVLVTPNDAIIGHAEKELCHDGNGLLHRAFSVFVFNENGQLLLQQRSREKRLWPLFWSNSCCSHPRRDEPYEVAAKRRVYEELGMRAEVKYLYKFLYQASYKLVGSEHELCAVLIGKSSDVPVLNPQEVSAFRWIDFEEAYHDTARRPNLYTPWFKMEVGEIYEKYRESLEKFRR